MEQNGSRLDRIEYLVASLAKSGAETDERLRSLGEGTDRRLKSLGDELNSLGEKTDRRINALLETMAQHNDRLDDVYHGLVLLGPAVERYAENTQLRIDALAEAQHRTENNLNTLISVVDGLVRRPPQ
jgi:hypothetical protein